MVRSARKAKDQELNINLIPQEEVGGTLGSTIKWSLGIGRYLIIVTEIIALVAFGLSLKLTIDKNNLNSQIKNHQSIIDSKAEFEQEFRSVQEKLDNIKSIRSKHFNYHLAIAEFNKLLPQGINLDSLSIDQNELSFGGSFPTAAQLHTMINSFNSSDKIVGLDISELNSPSVTEPKFTFEAKAVIVESAFLPKFGEESKTTSPNSTPENNNSGVEQ